MICTYEMPSFLLTYIQEILYSVFEQNIDILFSASKAKSSSSSKKKSSSSSSKEELENINGLIKQVKQLFYSYLQHIFSVKTQNLVKIVSLFKNVNLILLRFKVFKLSR